MGSSKDENVIDDQLADEGLLDGKTAEKSAKKQAAEKSKNGKPKDTAQIEYLIHQSTQGVHFLFDKKDVSRVMMVPTDEKDFFTMKNMERVQSLLSRFLGKPTLNDKERFLRSLSATERDLMIRAYFHLVENAIRSNSDLSH
ncbi:MAG: hypothetical protein J0L82_15520 [Deltaproteobacteria bacterium]|nr:hypothetical protein [Deltaproteobacteria bacterium]